jgi:NTP pyrophosphatase (non-canonical NTP hydrolase)
MKKEYKPETFKQKLGYLIEECGELQSALGKTIRWGLNSFNPELPAEEQESNREWILREIKDVKRAIGFVEKSIDSEV